jgi:hypothetical protein
MVEREGAVVRLRAAMSISVEIGGRLRVLSL